MAYREDFQNLTPRTEMEDQEAKHQSSKIAGGKTLILQQLATYSAHSNLGS